ncbi:hypothetical protein ABPG72_014825 [Tetrahymena utriculariae]
MNINNHQQVGGLELKTNELFEEKILAPLNTRQINLATQNPQILAPSEVSYHSGVDDSNIEINKQEIKIYVKNQQNQLKIQTIQQFKESSSTTLKSDEQPQFIEDHTNQNENSLQKNNFDKSKQEKQNQEQMSENFKQQVVNTSPKQDDQNENDLILRIGDQSRSITLSSNISNSQNMNSCSSSEQSIEKDEESSSFEDDSFKIIEEKIDLIQMNLKQSSKNLNTSHNSQNQLNNKNQMNSSIENFFSDSKNVNIANLNTKQSIGQDKKKRLSLFNSQQKISFLQQKQSVMSQNNDSNQTLNQLQHKFSLLNPQRKKDSQKLRKQSIEYNLSFMPSLEQQKYVTREKSEQYIELMSQKNSLVQSDDKIDLLLGIRRKALIKTIQNNDKFYSQMRIQQEINANVFQLENPTLNHLGVQKFVKDFMRKTNKAPKEKNLLKKVIEKLGVFETQKDIIFKNQNTNDTLFDNLNLESFEKHQCIFHIGEFGYKYYIIVQGSVHLLLPQMDQKGATDNSIYVNYMNSIQQGYQNKSQDEKQHSQHFKLVSLYNCSFFTRCFVNNQNQAKIKQWVNDIGSDVKKISLLFGGLDYEKRLLINAAFLEGKEFVNIFYPNMFLYKTFKPGECFGEIALLTKQRRTATMVCAEKTYCLTLSKQGFDKIVGAYQNSMIQAQLNFLQQFSFIEKIPKSKLLSITHDMKKNEYSKGQIIYKEGDSPDFFYFIINGEFEISKQENIHKSNNPRYFSNSYKNVQLINKDNEEISSLNWSQKLKQQKTDIKRIPIVILQANQYFGQYEIFQNQQTRQTKAACTSLKGTLYQVPKSILLYHLNAWNGLDEMKQANQVINNWQNNRITQIKHLNQLAENLSNDIFNYQNVRKTKKSKLKKSESQYLQQKKQSDSFTGNQDRSFSNSFYNRSPLQSPFNSSKQFQISSFSQVKQLQNISYKYEISPKNINETMVQNSFQQDLPKSQEKNNLPNQPASQSDLNPQKQIQPQTLPLPQYIYSSPQKQAQQNGQIQNQSLKDSASFESSEIKDSDLMESSLNSKSFQKFKKFHEKKLNEKVHQLLDQEKKSDKRKSEYLLNILDQQQFKFIKSQPNSLERRESTTTNEELNQAQTKEQNPNCTQKLNKKQSIFFNNTMPISQFNSSYESNNNKLEIIIENKDFQKNKNQQLINNLPLTPNEQNRQQHEINEKSVFPQVKNQKEKLEFKQQLESSQIQNYNIRNSIQNFKSGNQNQNYSCGNQIENQQRADLVQSNSNCSQRVKAQNGINHQKLKNILDISKSQIQQTQSIPIGQSDSQYFSGNRFRQLKQLDSLEKNTSQGSSQLNKNVYPNYKNKDQANITQLKGVSNQSQNHLSPKGNFEQNFTAFNQKDKLLEKKNHGQESSSQRHDMCKTFSQGFVGDLKNQQIEQKELNKMKKQQFLEKISNRVCFCKANEQSINNENYQYDQLDYQAEQLKELIESSPAKICSNINNILSFKKKFLKILKSQPEILQKKLFDLKQEKDKYSYQKLTSSNNKLVSNNLNQNSQNLTANKDEKLVQSNQTNQMSLDKKQNEESNLNYSTMQDSIKENNTNFEEENHSFKQTKNKKPHKIQSPIDSILLFIKKQKAQENEINSTEQSSFERYGQDSIFSNMNQTSTELKNSFFQSPKINFSEQYQSKQDKNNLGTKIVDIIDKSTINNIEFLQDLSINPEAGLVKKLSILSQKQLQNNGLIYINFQNQIQNQKHNVNSFKSQQFTSPNNQAQRSKSHKHFEFKSFQTERLSKIAQEKQNQINLKTQSSQEKNIHQLTSINFSVNQETGKTDDSNYVISSLLTLRKPFSQRIKEKQIKQKGNSFTFQNNFNPSKTFRTTKDPASFQEDVSFKQQTTKSSQNLLSIQNFYSNNSPKIQDSVYHFQKVAPSKRVQKSFFLNS